METNDKVMKIAGGTVLLGQVTAKCNLNGWQFIHVDWASPDAHDLICGNMKDSKSVSALTAGRDWIRFDQVVKINLAEILDQFSALCSDDCKQLVRIKSIFRM